MSPALLNIFYFEVAYMELELGDPFQVWPAQLTETLSQNFKKNLKRARNVAHVKALDSVPSTRGEGEGPKVSARM